MLSDELARGVREARRLVMVLNLLYKTRVYVSHREGGLGARHLEILLILKKEGGAALLTKLSERTGLTTRQTYTFLKEMESAGLVKVLEAPTRVGVVLTGKGRVVAAEIVKALA